MKYVIVALVFAFSATGADAHYPARAHHARYKHHPPPAYPEAYAAPDSLGIAGDIGGPTSRTCLAARHQPRINDLTFGRPKTRP